MANEAELFLYFLALLFSLLWRVHGGLKTVEKLLKTKRHGSRSGNPGPCQRSKPSTRFLLPSVESLNPISTEFSRADCGAGAPAEEESSFPAFRNEKRRVGFLCCLLGPALFTPDAQLWPDSCLSRRESPGGPYEAPKMGPPFSCLSRIGGSLF